MQSAMYATTISVRHRRLTLNEGHLQFSTDPSTFLTREYGSVDSSVSSVLLVSSASRLTVSCTIMVLDIVCCMFYRKSACTAVCQSHACHTILAVGRTDVDRAVSWWMNAPPSFSLAAAAESADTHRWSQTRLQRSDNTTESPVSRQHHSMKYYHPVGSYDTAPEFPGVS